MLGTPKWNGRSPRFVCQRSPRIRKAGVSDGRIEEPQSCSIHRRYVSSKALVGVRRFGIVFYGGSPINLGKGLHTKDGKAKIRPAVEKLCKE